MVKLLYALGLCGALMFVAGIYYAFFVSSGVALAMGISLMSYGSGLVVSGLASACAIEQLIEIKTLLQKQQRS